MHSLEENYKVVEFYPITDITSATTTNGTGVDCKEMDDDILAIIQLGAMTGDHTADIKFQESDASGSGYTDITGAVATQLDEDSDGKIATVGFKRAKRYVRAVIVTAGTVTANVVGISGLIESTYGKSDLNSATAA